MKKLTKRGFMAWLRKIDGQPCGSTHRCPIATYLNLPMEDDGADGAPEPNQLASDLAHKAGLGDFIEWADNQEDERGNEHAWETITGDAALEFFTGA